MNLLFEKITVAGTRGAGVLPDAFVAVEGRKIKSVTAVKPEGFTADRVINGRGRVLMPGLVNTHTHLPMTLLRGYADDYDLQEWLTRYIFPAEDRLDEDCVYTGATLAIAESIASGTTAANDMYFFCDAIARAAYESGINANISRALMGSVGEEGPDAGAAARFAEMRALRENWHMAGDGRIKIAASIHAEYTSEPGLWRSTADYAGENDLSMHIHLSETKREHDECVKRYGFTPTRMFLQSGVFDRPVTAAHCVWLTDEDMDILAEKRVSVLHNPTSNLKLASGIARVADMQNRGINVSLGTDGAASNNCLDMFGEMKLAAILQKAATGDPKALPAKAAFEMATVCGAKALGRDLETGVIEAGFDADLIMLDFTKPGLTPCHDAVSSIVYSTRGGDVALTMVRGRILYENGEFTTIDIEKTRYEAENSCLKKLFPDKAR